MGSRPARLTVLGGQAAALLAIAAFAFTNTRNVAVFAVLVAVWSLFAWALNPPMQASILTAAPAAGMTAMALNISGLYLGTGVAAALGGVILSVSRIAYLPLVAGLLVLAALALGSGRTMDRETSPPTRNHHAVSRRILNDDRQSVTRAPAAGVRSRVGGCLQPEVSVSQWRWASR